MPISGPPFLCPSCSSRHNTLHGVKIHIGKSSECKSSLASLNISTTVNSENIQPSSPDDSQQQVQDFGAQLAALYGSSRRLRHIPKGARFQAAEALAVILETIVSRQDIDSWLDLLAFPVVALQFPSKPDKVSNLTTWVKANIRNWTVSRRSALPSPLIRQQKSNQNRDFQRNKIVERKLADGDIQGAIRLLSSDDILTQPSLSTYEALLHKHPPHPEPAIYPDPPLDLTKPLAVSVDELREAIRSFHPGSAGGLDGLCPKILKDITLDLSISNQDRLLKALGFFIDLIIAGAVPEAIRPVFFGASLISLSKKDGGVRPIAIGTIWRRLAAKIVCVRLRPELKAHLSPLQLGVAVSCGAEIGAHAARCYLTATHPTTRACVKLDFQNAFNELRRDSMLREVASFCPTYFPFIASCYDRASYLYHGERIILSQRGVQQGDPLGPALFALTLHPVIRDIPCDFNVWYLDDGTIADAPQKLLNVLPSLTNDAASIGLHLRFSKCELLLPGNLDEQTRQHLHSSFLERAPDIRLVPLDHAYLLGAPLTPMATAHMLDTKNEILQMYLARLAALSSQAAFYLLRASFAIPRLIFFLRSAPTWRLTSQLDAMDNALQAGLESILNCTLSRQSWDQASLPANVGGLGVRRASDLAIPAFLASWFHALPLVSTIVGPYCIDQQPEANEALSVWTNNVKDPTLPTEEVKASQNFWDMTMARTAFSRLLEDTTEATSKARLLAASAPEAGAWLNALPSPQLGLHLNNECFRIAAALRLGVPICLEHTCPCGATVDVLGLHGLSCRKSAGRISRHANINDLLHRALTSAAVPSILEPTGCDRTDGKRPDGGTLVPWHRGKSLLWDFTCADTFAQTYLPSTSVSPGAAAVQRETMKTRKYANLSDKFHFTPVAIETAGPWGNAGLAFVKEIGRRITQATTNTRATSHLLQRISVALQRGNAACILGTIPPGKGLTEISLLF